MMTTETVATPAPTEIPNNRLSREIKGIVGKAEHLLKDASHSAAMEFSATRHAVSETACSAAAATDDYVRGNPWKIVGIAAVAGLFIGALVNRR
jgi:ElaB/YqjD/DUF883 family membrane-anchored ribosome-binding protein